MAEMTRKKIRWATKKRNGGSRKWKTAYIWVPKQSPKSEAKKEHGPRKS
ncbi:MAG TPA: hypothetical protein PK308_06420 [Phycisphaerales bacterium]|jgi:hypothetical protein|nr:hypothetical protein [Phycisphaerales bacterium]